MSATPRRRHPGDEGSTDGDSPTDPSEHATDSNAALRDAVMDMGRLAAAAQKAIEASGGSSPPPSTLVRIERIKLYATYLNTIAAGFAVTGVVGPIANFLYGTTSQTTRSLWQLVAEIGILMVASLLLHLTARAVLGRLDA